MKRYKGNKILKNIKYQKGFALVEVIAAIGVSALVITALISLSMSTLRTSLNSKLLLEGTKIANRQIELVRAYRDGYKDADTPRSWQEFISDLHDCEVFNGGESFSCYMNENGLVEHGVGEKGNGAEKISYQFIMTDTDGTQIEPMENPSIVRISVSVTWMVGDQQKGSYIYTDLSNWRGR